MAGLRELLNFIGNDFRIDLFVRQQWIDPRLKMADYHFEEGDDYVTLPPEFFDNMWQPDPYFFNSKVVRKYSNHSSSVGGVKGRWPLGVLGKLAGYGPE